MRVEILFVVRILYLGTQASVRCDIWRQITMVMIIILIIIIKQVIDEMVLCWSMLYDPVSPNTLASVGHVGLSRMHTCAQTKHDLRGRHWTYRFMIDWRAIHNLQYIMACKLPRCHETTYKMGILGVVKFNHPPKTQAKPSLYKLTTYVRRDNYIVGPPRPKNRWLTIQKIATNESPAPSIRNSPESQLDFHFSTPQNASSEFIERRPENETQGKCSRNAVNTGCPNNPQITLHLQLFPTL